MSLQYKDINTLINEIETQTSVEPLGQNASARQITEWIQRRIARETGTDINQIGPDVPLTQLGISSICALGITGDLAEALGRELPETLLWDHPTIQSVAAFLDSTAPHNPDEIIPELLERAVRFGLSETHYRRLHESTASWASARAKPGFLINVISEHPGSVPVFWICDYKGSYPLSTHLNQTLYAMSSGLRLLRHTEANVHALAKVYAGEITQLISSKQPCVLAGYCFGGKLALEIARVLQKRRQPVELVLVESPGPARAYWIEYRLLKSGAQLREKLLRHARTIMSKPSGAVRHIGAVASRANGRQKPAPGPKVYEATTRHWEYHPRPTNLSTTLVFANKSRYRRPHAPKYGWNDILKGKTRTRILPGDHFSIIRDTNVAPLATLINSLSNQRAPRGKAARTQRN